MSKSPFLVWWCHSGGYMIERVVEQEIVYQCKTPLTSSGCEVRVTVQLLQYFGPHRLHVVSAH